MKKVVIIGGSHSGFSAAWLLMNGPADVLHNSHVKPTCSINHTEKGKPFEFPYCQLKQAQDCTLCCICKRQKGCDCVCKCYGFFKYQTTDFDYAELPQWNPDSIKILYRENIRVFYSKVEFAQQDNYTEYNPTVFSNKKGFLYSFTGLRGDARTLYREIKSGKESRVQLVKCPTAEDQLKHVEEADLVIWACGYET